MANDEETFTRVTSEDEETEISGSQDDSEESDTDDSNYDTEIEFGYKSSQSSKDTTGLPPDLENHYCYEVSQHVTAETISQSYRDNSSCVDLMILDGTIDESASKSNVLIPLVEDIIPSADACTDSEEFQIDMINSQEVIVRNAIDRYDDCGMKGTALEKETSDVIDANQVQDVYSNDSFDGIDCIQRHPHDDYVKFMQRDGFIQHSKNIEKQDALKKCYNADDSKEHSLPFSKQDDNSEKENSLTAGPPNESMHQSSVCIVLDYCEDRLNDMKCKSDVCEPILKDSSYLETCKCHCSQTFSDEINEFGLSQVEDIALMEWHETEISKGPTVLGETSGDKENEYNYGKAREIPTSGQQRDKEVSRNFFIMYETEAIHDIRENEWRQKDNQKHKLSSSDPQGKGVNNGTQPLSKSVTETQVTQARNIKHLTRNPLTPWKRLMDINVESMRRRKFNSVKNDVPCENEDSFLNLVKEKLAITPFRQCQSNELKPDEHGIDKPVSPNVSISREKSPETEEIYPERDVIQSEINPNNSCSSDLINFSDTNCHKDSLIPMNTKDDNINIVNEVNNDGYSDSWGIAIIHNDNYRRGSDCSCPDDPESKISRENVRPLPSLNSDYRHEVSQDDQYQVTNESHSNSHDDVVVMEKTGSESVSDPAGKDAIVEVQLSEVSRDNYFTLSWDQSNERNGKPNLPDSICSPEHASGIKSIFVTDHPEITDETKRKFASDMIADSEMIREKRQTSVIDCQLLLTGRSETSEGYCGDYQESRQTEMTEVAFCVETESDADTQIIHRAFVDCYDNDVEIATYFSTDKDKVNICGDLCAEHANEASRKDQCHETTCVTAHEKVAQEFVTFHVGELMVFNSNGVNEGTNVVDEDRDAHKMKVAETRVLRWDDLIDNVCCRNSMFDNDERPYSIQKDIGKCSSLKYGSNSQHDLHQSLSIENNNYFSKSSYAARKRRKLSQTEISIPRKTSRSTFEMPGVDTSNRAYHNGGNEVPSQSFPEAPLPCFMYTVMTDAKKIEQSAQISSRCLVAGDHQINANIRRLSRNPSTQWKRLVDSNISSLVETETCTVVRDRHGAGDFKKNSPCVKKMSTVNEIQKSTDHVDNMRDSLSPTERNNGMNVEQPCLPNAGFVEPEIEGSENIDILGELGKRVVTLIQSEVQNDTTHPITAPSKSSCTGKTDDYPSINYSMGNTVTDVVKMLEVSCDMEFKDDGHEGSALSVSNTAETTSNEFTVAQSTACDPFTEERPVSEISRRWNYDFLDHGLESRNNETSKRSQWNQREITKDRRLSQKGIDKAFPLLNPSLNHIQNKTETWEIALHDVKLGVVWADQTDQKKPTKTENFMAKKVMEIPCTSISEVLSSPKMGERLNAQSNISSELPIYKVEPTCQDLSTNRRDVPNMAVKTFRSSEKSESILAPLQEIILIGNRSSELKLPTDSDLQMLDHGWAQSVVSQRVEAKNSVLNTYDFKQGAAQNSSKRHLHNQESSTLCDLDDSLSTSTYDDQATKDLIPKFNTKSSEPSKSCSRDVIELSDHNLEQNCTDGISEKASRKSRTRISNFVAKIFGKSSVKENNRESCERDERMKDQFDHDQLQAEKLVSKSHRHIRKERAAVSPNGTKHCETEKPWWDRNDVPRNIIILPAAPALNRTGSMTFDRESLSKYSYKHSPEEPENPFRVNNSAAAAMQRSSNTMNALDSLCSPTSKIPSLIKSRIPVPVAPLSVNRSKYRRTAKEIKHHHDENEKDKDKNKKEELQEGKKKDPESSSGIGASLQSYQKVGEATSRKAALTGYEAHGSRTNCLTNGHKDNSKIGHHEKGGETVDDITELDEETCKERSHSAIQFRQKIPVISRDNDASKSVSSIQGSVSIVKFGDKPKSGNEKLAFNSRGVSNETVLSDYFKRSLSLNTLSIADAQTVVSPYTSLNIQTIPIAVQPTNELLSTDLGMTTPDTKLLDSRPFSSYMEDANKFLRRSLEDLTQIPLKRGFPVLEPKNMYGEASEKTALAKGDPLTGDRNDHTNDRLKQLGGDLLQSSLECMLEMLLQRGKVLRAFIANNKGKILAKTAGLNLDEKDTKSLMFSLFASYKGMVKLTICDEVYICFKHENDSSLVGRAEKDLFVARQGKLSFVVGFADPSSSGSCIKEIQELSHVLGQRGL